MGKHRVRVGTSALLIILVLLVGAAPAGAADADGDGVSNGNDRCPNQAGPRPSGCPVGKWRLRNTNSAGPADVRFQFGITAWTPVAGDWNGDGNDTVGAYDPQNGRWRLAELVEVPDAETFTTVYVEYTISGIVAPEPHIPMTGDWDGDGDDTGGIYTPRTGQFHLRNSNTTGPPELVFAFGGVQPARSVQPVAGNWDGDGDDTVGLFRPDTNRWRLRNSNTAGSPDLQFTFGRPGNADQPLVGDIDGGGGIDGIGVSLMEDEGIFWFFRTTPSPGPAETQFSWGACPGCSSAVVGDWDGDGIDTAGFRR